MSTATSSDVWSKLTWAGWHASTVAKAEEEKAQDPWSMRGYSEMFFFHKDEGVDKPCQGPCHWLSSCDKQNFQKQSARQPGAQSLEKLVAGTEVCGLRDPSWTPIPRLRGAAPDGFIVGMKLRG